MMLPKSKHLTIALALSLGLNLFLGGFWAARCTAQGMRGAHPRGPTKSMEGDFSSSPALRRALEERAGVRAKRDGMREARRQAFEAFKAPAFDRQAAATALQRLRHENTELQESLHSALLEAAVDMPVEERRKLVRRERGRERP